MTGRPRHPGWALLAALVLAAALPAAAQADSTSRLMPEGEKGGTITGQQSGVSFKFEYGGRTVRCETVAFTETLNGPTTIVPFSPFLSGCYVPNFLGWTLEATFTVNGCDFAAEGVPTTEVPGYWGKFDLQCPAGKNLEVHIYQPVEPLEHTWETQLCSITVKQQAGIGDLSFENWQNIGQKKEVLVGTEEVEYQVTRHGSSLCGPVQGQAKVSGVLTLTAYDKEANPIDLQVGHKTK